jgi:hypothetical protein
MISKQLSRVGRLRNRVSEVHQLGPDAPPVGRPKIAPGHGALGKHLDLDAALRRNGPLITQPLADCLRANAERARQGRVAAKDLGCGLEGHASERKALLHIPQEALLARQPARDDQAMLPKGKELGEKIRRALDLAKVQPAEAAHLFGVSRQAVNSWFKTGRIGKNKLLEIIRITVEHVPPGYWQDAKIVEIATGQAVRTTPRSERRPAWPFTTDEQSVCGLPADVLALIDLQLSHHVKQHLTREPRRRARQS